MDAGRQGTGEGDAPKGNSRRRQQQQQRHHSCSQFTLPDPPPLTVCSITVRTEFIHDLTLDVWAQECVSV